MTPLTPQALWRLRRVGPPVVTPDGATLIVPVTDHGDDGAVTILYRVPATGGDPVALTAPGRAATAPAVSPDGGRLAFLRKPTEMEQPQVAVMALDGGEARSVTDLPLGVTDVRWLPDGSGLVVLAPVLIDAPDLDATRDLVASRADRGPSPIVTEDRVFRFWDRWLVGGQAHHLVRVDLGTGDVVDLLPGSTRWFDLMDPAGTWDVSPDGAEVAFAADVSEPPHDRLQTAVLTVPTDGSGTVTQLSAELPAYQSRPRYSPDGGLLVWGMQREYDFYADPVRIVRYDRATGTETVLTEEWDRSASGWEFADDGETLVLGAEEAARHNLYRMSVAAGATTPALLVRGGWTHRPRPDRAGFVYFALDSLRGPAEVHRVPIAGGEPTRITGFNSELLAAVELGEVEEITVDGANGHPIQAFLVYPPGHDRARPAPLVHMVHGGPHGVFGDQWHARWNAQAFAAPGYVIALVNFHGSSSWGYDFATSIDGAWGDLPTADVLAATDHLVAAGIADPDRMAIAGGSYGGYLVAWITTQTDRFAASICHAGVTNLVGQYASDVTQGRHRSLGAEVWEDPDQVMRWSPTAHAAGMATPTLVIHGEKDYRVVVTQGLELYGILKAKGVDSRLVYFPDEGHWVLDRDHALLWWDEVLGWLERYLGNPGVSSP